MSSKLCISDPVSETFKTLIRTVPKNEKEAEVITLTVRRMLLKYPSLLRRIELNQKEEEALQKILSDVLQAVNKSTS